MDDVAPGFEDSVLARQIIGPKQMQQGWDLIGGNIFHGELTTDQLFHMRPAVGFADYRTPIAGLYQASSATHAGGGAWPEASWHSRVPRCRQTLWKARTCPASSRRTMSSASAIENRK